MQGLLELADVAYVGAGVLGSALAMDKAMAKQVLAANGIPQARYRAFADHQRTPGLPDRARRRARPAVLRQARQHGLVRRGVQGEDRRAAARRHRPRVDLRRVGARRGGRRRSGDRGRRARRHRTRGLAARGDHPERRVLRLRGQVRHRRRPAARAGTADTPPRRTPCGTWPCGSSSCCAATVWPASTSSSKRAGAASCATRPTRCPASRRSRCTRSCGRPAGMTYPELIDRLVALAVERHDRRRRNTKH